MQAMADPAGTLTSPGIINTTERRPVRLLVPTERRTIWHVSQEDTLRAAELGLTRATDDAALARMVPAARRMLLDTEDPQAWLHRIRDGLRHPRDIDEARYWGMTVPDGQNVEEFDPEPTKRTGWWWVLDPTRDESRDEREARLLADKRQLDMKGIARVWQRKYVTVKDFKVDSDRVRKLLRDKEFLRLEALKRVDRARAQEIRLDIGTAIEEELAYARKFVHKAMPPRRDRSGQSDVWWVSDACRIGRDTTRLDEWYEFSVVRQTGRPPGSKTKRRHAA